MKKPGRAVALAVGGAEESLLSRPHTLDLVLKKRQGFIRIALQTGTAAAAHHALILKWLTSWADRAHVCTILCALLYSKLMLHLAMWVSAIALPAYNDAQGQSVLC